MSEWTELHYQYERGGFMTYVGAWWTRWAFGLIGSRDSEGCCLSCALCFGPFYVGVGWQR